MPIEISSPNENIAAIFAANGLQTLWISNASQEEIEAVFPFGQETAFLALAGRFAREITREFRGVARVTPRTILYHLALERFGGISPSLQVSTSITNLQNPDTKTIVGLAIPQLSYDVRIAAIAVPHGQRGRAQQRIANAAALFNVVSPYMTIGTLSIAFVNTRLQAGPVTGYQQVTIPTPPLSLD